MQRYLFLDNCRGFSRAWIPLVDVNFLVGENSTGKTSVLLLSRLLLSPKLFTEPGCAEATRLGLFKEIVSAHSDDPSYFRIGATDVRPGGDGKSLFGGMLFTFIQQDGVARLSTVTCATGQREVTLVFEERAVYRSMTDVSVDSLDGMNKRLEGWCEVHSKGTAPRTQLNLPENVGQGLPLLFILSWMAAQNGEQQAAPGAPAPVLPPYFGADPVWISPIRAKSRRTYDEPETAYSSEGGHSPYVIRKMLTDPEKARRFNDFMGRVGKRSGLFEGIKAVSFGTDPFGPFELDAIIGGLPLNLSWVGYGVSQALPILVEILARQGEAWFAIQQPEVHLHPRAQAAMGDVFFEAATERKRFLIETHSDFTIDRFRMNYRHGKRSTHPVSQILFFERRNNHNVVTPIGITGAGDISDDQPAAYRRFFVREGTRLLGL